MLPGTESPADQPDPSPDTDHLFEAFRAARSSQEMLALAAATPDDALDALEQDVEARLAAAEGDETIALHERLKSLRDLRAGHADDIQHMRDLGSQLAEMPGEQRLLLAFTSAASTADIMRLVAETSDEDLDHLETAAAALQAEATGDEQEALADQLVAWIQTPNWAASQMFLQENAAELLTDAGAAAMTLLRINNADHQQIELHDKLLAACRAQGVDAAYAQLRQEMEAEEQLQNNPVLQAVIAFLQADDAAARQQLADPAFTLLTADVRNLLEQFLAGARQAGDARAEALIAERLAWVQEARLARYPTPASSPGALATLGAETLPALQTLATGEGVKYLIVSPQNCTIGDNGITINSFGVVPLKWRRPEEFQRNLTEKAVGRREELADLRRALANGSAAVVGKGASGALHGLPGVGKSTLAALYAETYAGDYPGGVLWLQLTPDMTTPESAGSELSRAAAYAYSMDVQAWRMFIAAQQLPGADPAAVLRGATFAPEIVRGLLTDHGRLLVVADNVWERAVVAPIRAILPFDAHLLVTVRGRSKWR